MTNRGAVVSVCLKPEPGLPKVRVEEIELVEDFGVRGDYHAGPFVRHRHLARKDPTRPNLRQVLLADTTLLSGLARQGIVLSPGMLGENVVVDGISVMALAVGARVKVGEATLELTEVRNPCDQLNGMHPGLHAAVRSPAGSEARHNAGMLARVVEGGRVRPGDDVRLLPELA
jgi:MOSC domain-containing protein YiiM